MQGPAHGEYERGELNMLERKGWALDTPGARKLLNEFPRELKNKLVGCYFEDDTTSEDAMQVLEYLTFGSSITRIIREAPGSAMAFEYLYRFKEPEDPIDAYFVNSLSGYHVYLRLKALEKNLPYWVGQFTPNPERIFIDNIGSGPGHDLINVLAANPELAQSVHVRNIDIDAEALEIGRKRVRELGLEGSFSFVCGSFHKVKRRDAHLVMLVGMLCPMPMEMCKKILRICARYVHAGGLIIYSTNQTAMKQWDPFTDFLMRLAGWVQDYKTEHESAKIATDAGLQYVSQFFDEYLHFQCMTIARV